MFFHRVKMCDNGGVKKGRGAENKSEWKSDQRGSIRGFLQMQNRKLFCLGQDIWKQ